MLRRRLKKLIKKTKARNLCQGILTIILKGEVSVRQTSLSLLVRIRLKKNASFSWFSWFLTSRYEEVSRTNTSPFFKGESSLAPAWAYLSLLSPSIAQLRWSLFQWFTLILDRQALSFFHAIPRESKTFRKSWDWTLVLLLYKYPLSNHFYLYNQSNQSNN